MHICQDEIIPLLQFIPTGLMYLRNGWFKLINKVSARRS